MPRIQDAWLPQALRTRYSLKGAAPIDTLAPEIVPVTLVDVLPQPSPFLRRIGAQTVPGAAGFLSECGLKTDVGLLHVHHCILSSGTTTTWRLRTGGPQGTTTSFVTQPRDLRQGVFGSTLGLVTRANDHAAGGGSVLMHLPILNNTPTIVPLDMYIGGGNEVHWDIESANVGIYVNWIFDIYLDESIVP